MPRRRFSSALLVLLTVAGCAEPPVPPPPAPPEVTVAVPERRDVEGYLEFTGQTAAFEQVEVRARVRGFLEAVHFSPSDTVRKGALLFSIEDEDYSAARDQAEADVLNWQSELARLTADLQRLELAVESNAVSLQEVDAARASRDQAEASLMASRARLRQAELDLSYTQIHAPIAGRVNRWFVDPGNLVGSSDNTLLTDIVRLDPVFAYWEMSESILLELLSSQREGGGSSDGGFERDEIPVQLGLANEAGWPHDGWIDFADNTVDSSTGTIRMRGVFPNPDGAVIPGLFARIRLPLRVTAGAVLVPESAIGTDLGGKYLLVVGSDNVVELRHVQLGQQEGTLRVINEGLEHGEQIIVAGIQRARPGLPVNPTSQGS